MMKVHINLLPILKERGMSQRELAKRVGVRQPSVNEMCRNITKQVTLDNLAKICEVLDCDIADVLKLVPVDKKEDDKA